MTLEIRRDDLTGAATRALVATHLEQVHAGSPPESVHAWGLHQLRDPAVQVWSAWQGEDLAGIGALARLDATRGEIKSMRVASAHLGTGVGRALLRHMIAAARADGLSSLWLETGSADEFAAARSLYLSEGFVPCPPFGGYRDDPLSVFFTRAL